MSWLAAVVALTGLAIAAGPAVAQSVVLSGSVVGSRPATIGFDVGDFRNNNTAPWWRYSGVNAQPAAAPASLAPGDPDPAAGRWEAAVAAYEQLDREQPPHPGGVCLAGSSNVRLWTTLATDFPGMNVLNRGVGGCRLAELADFAPRLVAAAKPRVIVVSAGTNDVHAGATAEQVREAFARLVAALRPASPDATIAFLAIAPSISRWDELERQRAANEAIRDFIAASDDRGLRYLDANAAFLGPDGRPDPACFVEDLQHPSPVGNARRAALLRPLFAELLAEPR